jgi:hypothetical protein
MDNIPFKALGLMYRGYKNMVIRHVCFIRLTFSFELASSSSQRAMSWFRVGFVFGWVWGCKAGGIYIILKLFQTIKLIKSRNNKKSQKMNLFIYVN